MTLSSAAAPATQPAAPKPGSMRGHERPLATRIGLTYAALTLGVLVGVIVGGAVGGGLYLLMERPDEPWSAVGAILVGIGAFALTALAAAALAAVLLRLGWLTALGLVVIMVVPVPLLSSITGATPGWPLLLAMALPACLGWAIHGHGWPAAGATVAVLLAMAAGMLLSTWQRDAELREARVEEIASAGVVLYGPPEQTNVRMNRLTSRPASQEVEYWLLQGDTRWQVTLTTAPPAGLGALADGESVEQQGAVITRRGDTYVQVVTGERRGQPDPDAARDFASSLVERSPESMVETWMSR